ncbi:hypothetical protein [Marinobacter sp. MBR-105]
MTNITEKEVRAILEYAIEQKNPDAARTAIRLGVWGKAGVYKMDDLHFPLLLLLAMPEGEKRGRPKDPDGDLKLWFLNIACKVKAEIEGESFSKTWATYCDRTRPKMVEDELWRCAGNLMIFVNKGYKDAVNAARIFELSADDLKPLAVVKK